MERYVRVKKPRPKERRKGGKPPMAGEEKEKEKERGTEIEEGKACRLICACECFCVCKWCVAPPFCATQHVSSHPTVRDEPPVDFLFLLQIVNGCQHFFSIRRTVDDDAAMNASVPTRRKSAQKVGDRASCRASAA
jgi:hypothetical protein